MSPLEGLLYGLEVVVQPENLLAALLGAFVGTLVGILPGLGPTAGIAVLLPVTFTMDPVSGLIMIAGIYYGVQYGGSLTAIMMNIPGDAAAVMTTIDGYKMTQAGKAGKAIFIVTFGSFLAGTAATAVVVFMSPYIAKFGLKFGPAEFVAICTVALIIIAAGFGRPLDGLLPMLAGVAIATVGIEGVSGTTRMTGGSIELSAGFSVVVLAVGLFGLVEMLDLLARRRRAVVQQSPRLREMMPTRAEFRRATPAWARGSVLGFVCGLIPGPSTVISTFLAYRVEKTVSKHRDELGTGAIEGVAAPEAANNAAATAGMVPLLALGIPFTPALALMLAAMQIQGVVPGPLVATQSPDLFWGVIVSMFVGNVLLVILNLPLVGVWVSVLRLPKSILVPILVLVAGAGAFAEANRVFDLWIFLAAGLLGYLFRFAGLHLAPLILGLILGPLLEGNLSAAMRVGDGDVMYLFTRPIAAAIWLVLVACFVFVSVRAVRARRTPPSGPVTEEPSTLQDSRTG